MTAQIICMASAKGGSGKTAVAANMSRFLAALGKRVLLVDTDHSTNGLSLFFLDRIVAGREELKSDEGEPAGILQSASRAATACSLEKGLDLIPATYRLDPEDVVPETMDEFAKRLERMIKDFGDKYDYIVLDAQAGTDSYSRAAMKAADKIVIVTEFDPISVQGILRMKKQLGDGLSPQKTFVLMNKVLPEFAAASGEMREFLTELPILPPIPWDIDLVRAYVKRTLAVDVDRGNLYTTAIMKTTGRLFGGRVQTEIERWAADKADSLRKPDKEWLGKTEKQLRELSEMAARVRLDSRVNEFRSRSRTAQLLVLVGLVPNILLVALWSLSYVGTSTLLLLSTTTLGTGLLLYFAWQGRYRVAQFEDMTKRELLLQTYETQIEELKAFRARLQMQVESEGRFEVPATDDVKTSKVWR